MSDIETLSESAIVVLAGLRDASDRRRPPTPAAPDGYQRFFTITDLVADGLMLGGEVGNLRGIGELDKTARGLYKRGLVHKRTLHGHAYYALTDAGTVLVLRIEGEAGVTELAQAERASWQAAADAELAADRARRAHEALRAARKARGARYALEALLDTRREYPLARQA
jgi:hypothetical protein